MPISLTLPLSLGSASILLKSSLIEGASFWQCGQYMFMISMITTSAGMSAIVNSFLPVRPR